MNLDCFVIPFWQGRRIEEKIEKNVLTSAAVARGLGASGDSCGTGTAMASEHSVMAIKAKHFHDSVCILVYLFVFLIYFE